MKINTLKNATLFKADLPTIGEMRSLFANAEELAHRDILETQIACAGFIPCPATGMVFSPLASAGFAFCVRRDEKVLPRQAIARKVAERTAELEAIGTKVNRKLRESIKESVVIDMIKSAEYQTSFTYGLYHSASGTLLVNTTNTKLVNQLTGLLIKLCGSVKTHTIHIDGIQQGISTRLKAYLRSDDEAPTSFDSFTPLEFIKLTNGKEVATFKGCDLVDGRAGEVLSLLDAGYEVDELELWHDPMSFKLNSKFQFRGISLPPVEQEDDLEPAALWEHVNTTNMLMVSKACDDLCAMMEYKPAAQDKEAA